MSTNKGGFPFFGGRAERRRSNDAVADAARSAAVPAAVPPSRQPQDLAQPLSGIAAREADVESAGGEAATLETREDGALARERALVAEANRARAEGDHRRAARCYADAADLAPSRVDYRVMSGHCLKDAFDFRGAYEAYSAALAAAPSGDTNVQLGHLLKITGNLREAERGYREGARLGEGSASIELAAFGSISAAQLAFAHAEARPGDIPIETFWPVLACGAAEGLDPGSIMSAGKSLARAGQPDLAKGFFEIAHLSDEAGAFRQEHYALVQQTALWPPTHLSMLIRTRASRLDPRTTPARARLQRLIARLAADAGPDGDAWGPIAPEGEAAPEWPPPVLEVEAAERMLKALLDAVDRAYAAFYVETPISGAAVSEAMHGLRQSVLPSERFVVFPRGMTAADLRLVGANTLNLLARRWLRRFPASHVAASLAADLLVGGNRLSDLCSEIGSAAAVLDQFERLFPRSTEAVDAANRPVDQFLSWMAAAGAGPLSEAQFQDLLQETIKRGFENSVKALAWSLTAAQASSGRIIDCAQRLKEAGYSAFAYEFISRSLDEAPAPREYLVEKALLAKINGDFPTAARLFETLAAADPSDPFPRRELTAILPEIESIASILDRFQTDPVFLANAREKRFFRKALGEGSVNLDEAPFDAEVRIFDLAPELAGELVSRETGPREQIEILDVGRARRPGVGGEVVVLHACDFVRLRVRSRAEIVRMRARIDGRTVGTATPAPLASDDPFEPTRAYVVNCWMDLAGVATGEHELQVYLEERAGGYRTAELSVWVDPSFATPNPEESASLFDLPAETEGLSVEERVARLPAVVLPAERNVFGGEFRNVLVMRADQLGDVALSLPAMFALRGLFPEARLVCLASPSNRELLMSTGLFSEVLTVELTYDPHTHRRFATLAEQLSLRRILQPQSFDLAIDLTPAGQTRPLLRLACARYTAGFGTRDFPWLTLGVELGTRDVGNGREASPHSTRPMALVAALAGVMRHAAFRLPAPDIDPSLLAGLGLDPARPFAALHSGARTASRKWPLPHYLALAERLIEQRRLQVALLVDSAAELAGAKAAVLASPDLHVLAKPLAFSQLDALISRCALFVGNDTGPKHLASLRGAPVVSIHMGAVNWREWGQETGFIVTRRVPCYGCGIEQIEECGKGLPCLLDIKVEDVWGAVERALSPGAGAGTRIVGDKGAIDGRRLAPGQP